MSSREQIEDELQGALAPGERVQSWRQVVSGKVEDAAFETSLAMLGPSVFSGATHGAMTGAGSLPRNTNMVVVTDRRLLWCHKGLIGNEISVGGSDPLGALRAVELVPARIVLAKVRFVFVDHSVVQFDLPSDHRATEFADEVMDLIAPGLLPTAA